MKWDTTINLQYFNEINTRNKAYLLGFIAADGAIVKSTQHKGSSLTITIQAQDVAVLELLKKELNSSLEIKTINHKSKSLSSYKISVDHRRFVTGRKEIIAGLQSHGITHNKTFTISNLLENIQEEFKPAFIIGYFDGDGSFTDGLYTFKRKYTTKQGLKTCMQTAYRSCISIRGTKALLQGFVDYLDLSGYSLKQNKNEKIYTFNITCNKCILDFFNLYSYCDFYLERKKVKFTRKIKQVQTISSS